MELLKYSIVGGIAWLIDISSLIALKELLEVNYLIAAAIAFTLGLIVNYTLSVTWVFSRRKYHDKAKEFSIFTIIGLIGLLLNELLMWIFTDLIGMYYVHSKLLTTFIVFLWNFSMRKIILF